jgi:hypothetical protein
MPEPPQVACSDDVREEAETKVGAMMVTNRTCMAPSWSMQKYDQYGLGPQDPKPVATT